MSNPFKNPASELADAVGDLREAGHAIVDKVARSSQQRSLGHMLVDQGLKIILPDVGAPTPSPESKEYRTKSGRVLTDEDIERLADEAERGYDVKLKPCPPVDSFYHRVPIVVGVVRVLEERDAFEKRAMKSEEALKIQSTSRDHWKLVAEQMTDEADDLQEKLTEAKRILADAQDQQDRDVKMLHSRLARAARAYVREFDHLVGTMSSGGQYPEQAELKAALNDTAYRLD